MLQPIRRQFPTSSSFRASDILNQQIVHIRKYQLYTLISDEREISKIYPMRKYPIGEKIYLLLFQADISCWRDNVLERTQA